MFRTALDPSIRVAKITLHYARRLAGDKTVTFLSVSGEYNCR